MRTLKGSDVPGWPNPDQEIVIHQPTPQSVASWYFPHEDAFEDKMRDDLEREIAAAVEQGDPANGSATIAAAYFPAGICREALRDDIEQLIKQEASASHEPGHGTVHAGLSLHAGDPVQRDAATRTSWICRA
jgi:hypothetical protein